MAALSYWLFISRLPVDFGMPSMPAVACLAPGLIDRASMRHPGDRGAHLASGETSDATEAHPGEPMETQRLRRSYR
jgi:hypothetical protein